MLRRIFNSALRILGFQRSNEVTPKHPVTKSISGTLRAPVTSHPHRISRGLRHEDTLTRLFNTIGTGRGVSDCRRVQRLRDQRRRNSLRQLTEAEAREWLANNAPSML